MDNLILNPLQEMRLPEEPRRPVTPKLVRNLSFDNGSQSKLIQPKEQVHEHRKRIIEESYLVSLIKNWLHSSCSSSSSSLFNLES